MPITIGSNIQSLRAIRQLDRTSEALSNVSERLSSGQRVNRASDDAAGLAIADSLGAKTRVYSKSIQNVNDAASLLSIAEGAVQELKNISIRQKELAEQAANGSYGHKQRAAIDKEAEELTKEYNRIVQSTSFNSIKLFGEDALAGVRIQHGEGLSQSTQIAALADIGHLAGSGQYSSAVTSDYLQSYLAIQSADLNNDGNADILAVGSGTVVVHLGNGDNSFTDAISLTTPAALSGTGLIAQDFTGDGNIDIMATTSSGALMLFQGRGNGSFTAQNSFASGFATGAIESADFNNDGALDVVASASDKLTVYLNNGAGTFSQSFSAAAQNFYFDVKVGDTNRDGVEDIVYTGLGLSTVQAFGTGNGNFSAPVTISAGELPMSIALGDFNGDGALDVATQSQNFSGDVRIRLNDGTGNFGSFSSYTVGGQVQANTVLHSADVTNDGVDDVIIAGWNSYTIESLLGSTTGTLSRGQSLSWGDFTFPLAAGTADFNNDGIQDIFASSSNSRGLATFLGQGDPSRFVATVDAIDLSTVAGAKVALTTVTARLDRLVKAQGNIGASQSRLGSVLNTLSASRENSEAAQSRIVDADMASEAASAVRLRTLQQISSAILAQANFEPSLALSLLKGI